MLDIIRLLPDSLANQIAAGEVVQRPASVLKELMENAIDAGADNISVAITEAGRTLIQIIDNGKGMSLTDARMAFERHATSKITAIDDLFAIKTLGFRGEALASIAAVAEVNLKTRRVDDELGTEISIEGSKLISQEAVSCNVGSVFSVRNLFFNVPARRKFLKGNATELRHITMEFQHIVLAYPTISFKLSHNGNEIYNLPKTVLKQRILAVLGKGLNQSLIPVDVETDMVKISGFTGRPEHARKSSGEQFFFINGRYMRHPYFHRTLIDAYQGLITVDQVPAYVIFLEADPQTIDVNIHPTKTEIKFENERFIAQILQSGLKRTLGVTNAMPAIDFNYSGKLNMPVNMDIDKVSNPTVRVNTSFNPFEQERKHFDDYKTSIKQEVPAEWSQMYNQLQVSSINEDVKQEELQLSHEEIKSNSKTLMQFKGKYILSAVKSGLMIIDQKRAHERILFEKFIATRQQNALPAQQSMFPETIELQAIDFALLMELADELLFYGIDVRDFGNNSIIVQALPEQLKIKNVRHFIDELIQDFKETGSNPGIGIAERLARSLAVSSAISYGYLLSQEEMQHFIDSLFATGNPSYSPSGKLVLTTLKTDDIEKFF